MKKKIVTWTFSFFAILGSLASVTGLVVPIFSKIQIPTNLIFIVLSVLLGFAVGIFSKQIVETVRKISKRSLRVFISYPGYLSEHAQEIARKLQEQGILVWLNHFHIQPDDSISYKIERALGDTDIFIFLFSDKSSPWATIELEKALQGNLNILPIRIKEGNPPDLIKDVSYIDIPDETEGNLQIENIMDTLKVKKKKN